MFNTYNAGDTNLKINACSGGIYKTYKESWFVNFHLNSTLANTILRKEVEILQMIICGDKEVIAEVILKEDFEKYFEGSK